MFLNVVKSYILLQVFLFLFFCWFLFLNFWQVIFSTVPTRFRGMILLERYEQLLFFFFFNHLKYTKTFSSNWLTHLNCTKCFLELQRTLLLLWCDFIIYCMSSHCDWIYIIKLDSSKIVSFFPLLSYKTQPCSIWVYLWATIHSK